MFRCGCMRSWLRWFQESQRQANKLLWRFDKTEHNTVSAYRGHDFTYKVVADTPTQISVEGQFVVECCLTYFSILVFLVLLRKFLVLPCLFFNCTSIIILFCCSYVYFSICFVFCLQYFATTFSHFLDSFRFLLFV